MKHQSKKYTLEMNRENGHVIIRKGEVRLNAILGVPRGAYGIVVFAHGSGSSRLSPRNVYVAQALQKAGLGTLLLDLLTEEEEQDRHNVFDINLLADRLILAKEWLHSREETKSFNVGYFGASTGAAAALVAAAREPDNVSAVVSRGGRADLAYKALESVEAPTLLIVGGNDDVVVDLNWAAFENLHCTKEVRIVPHATHLFEEPGALEKVASLASQWFQKYLITPRPPSRRPVETRSKNRKDQK